MDKDLSFLSHIKKVENKLSKSVGILNKVKPFLNASTLLQLYCSIFHSYLQFSIIMWGWTFKSYLKKLNTLQNEAVKIIAGGSWRESATPFYAKLKSLEIQDMYLLELALIMFKFQAKQLPSSLLDYFKLTNAIHAKQTRSSTNDNYFLPCYKMMKLQRSIEHQGAKLWNSMVIRSKNQHLLNCLKKITKLSD